MKTENKIVNFSFSKNSYLSLCWPREPRQSLDFELKAALVHDILQLAAWRDRSHIRGLAGGRASYWDVGIHTLCSERTA